VTPEAGAGSLAVDVTVTARLFVYGTPPLISTFETTGSCVSTAIVSLIAVIE